MNNDRYPDLILIADSGTSKYFVNNQDGTFTDRTDEARGIETTNGMGVDVGDINNDGLLDMYVTSITYSSTNGPGNVLLIQNHDQSFDNTARINGTYDGYWGWGTLIADLDHDGDRDILETNGYVGTFAGNPSVIFENLDNGDSFNEVAQESGFFHNGQGRGMVRLDIENDGDLDIAIFENNGKLRLYQNNLVENSTDETSNWVRVTLDTSSRDSIAPDGIGAMINVITGNETQLLPMHCGSNHCSASPIEAHAGIGDSSTIDAVQIQWPDGSFTTITDVEPNQAISISASSHPADYNDDSTVNFNDIISFLSPLKSRSLASDHNGDQRVNFFDVYAFLNDYQDAISP